MVEPRGLLAPLAQVMSAGRSKSVSARAGRPGTAKPFSHVLEALMTVVFAGGLPRAVQTRHLLRVVGGRAAGVIAGSGSLGGAMVSSREDG